MKQIIENYHRKAGSTEIYVAPTDNIWPQADPMFELLSARCLEAGEVHELKKIITRRRLVDAIVKTDIKNLERCNFPIAACNPVMIGFVQIGYLNCNLQHHD